jgi:hypothetical protein
MEYYKILKLQSLFYLNNDGLVCLEEFKDIPNYEGCYQVSNLGRVKSLRRYVSHSLYGSMFIKESVLKQSFNGNGYLIVNLAKNTKYKTRTVHQLIAECFLNHKPCKFELVVGHKNDIRKHNYLENLHIITNRKNSDKHHLPSYSKYIGVHWQKNRKKWMARIYINKQRVYLGSFNLEIDAHNAYENKLKEITDAGI